MEGNDAGGGPPSFRIQGYDLVNLLGVTVTGELWLAHQHATGEQVALKRLRLGAGEPQRAEQARRLLTLLSMIDHPHLQRVREGLPFGDELVLVLDHADGGNLDQLLSGRGGLDPGEVVTTMGPVAEALAAAHERGLVHGDINPESILYMTDGRPMLGDIGLIGLIAGPDTLVMHGYRDPAAPGPPGMGSTPAGDVYSLAAVCYTALTGIIPQPGQPRRSLQEVLPDMAPGMVHAVEAGMQPRPDRRPDAAQFAERLYAACAPAAVRFPVGLVLSDADIAAALAQAGPPPAQSAAPGQPPGQSAEQPRAAPQQPTGPIDPFAQAAQGLHRPNQFGEIPTEVEDNEEFDDDRRSRVGVWLGIGAAVVLLAAGGGGGLWWWQHNQGAGSDPKASASQDTTEPTGAQVDPKRTEDPGSVGPTTPTTPAKTPAETTEPRPPSKRPSGPNAQWQTELGRLDALRAEAFAKPDPELLSRVYAPEADDLIAKDRKQVDICVQSGCRLEGLRYDIRDLDVVKSGTKRMVLRVVDQRQAYSLVSASGDSVPQPAGPVATRKITLTRHGTQWYIAAIEAA